MNTQHNYISLFEQGIKTYWQREALTDWGGSTLHYYELAEWIEKMHIMLESAGIKPGDKVAIYGKNGSNWAITFLGAMTYGAVIVPILHEFKEEQALNILRHSEAKLLFTSHALNLTAEATEISVIELTDFSVRTTTIESLTSAASNLDTLFSQRYPDGLQPTDISYYQADADSMALINYTSGSTGKSKGVMIPYRALWSNVQFLIDHVGTIISPGSVLSILPMAHMYGLTFELLSEMTIGMHVYFLTRMPSPTIIFKAMAEVKPTFIVCVPLILEKVVRKMIMPKISNLRVRTLLRLPFISQRIKRSIRTQLHQAFGGQFYEVIVGGAAFSSDVETLLHKVGFKYTVGYGATECAPLITYEDWDRFKLGSCGKAIPRMEVRIDSPDPAHVVGEILCRGDNVMLGYYKNEEETRRTLDPDGWYHTGDLGILTPDGTLYIRGRSKNMLLGPSGQNIYPEEIEDRLNAMTLVAESVVIQHDGRLYGLVYPDPEEVRQRSLDTEAIKTELDGMRRTLNAELPAYEQLAGIKVMQQEFEKTPKKSIKRFLYFDEEV